MMWDKLEQEIGYTNTRVVAYAVYLTFTYFSKRWHKHSRIIEWYTGLIPKYKRVVDEHYTKMVRLEVEEMKQSRRRDCNYLTQKYKL